MRLKVLITFIITILFTSCNSEEIEIVDVDSITLDWYLIKTTGGLAGVNEKYEEGTIVWFFDEVNSEITVKNINTDESSHDLLDSGTYKYSIKEINGNNYFFIENIEYGQFIMGSGQFTINGMKKIAEEKLDNFVYTFKRNVIIK